MKTRTRTRVSRTATLAAAAALAAGVLPAMATGASAAPSDYKSFGYLTFDSGTHTSTTDKLWATAVGSFDKADSLALTPTTYVQAYDLSDDGNTVVVAAQSRSLASSSYNSTYGLLLTQRSGVTRLITNAFDSNPVLSPDGSTVYWMYAGKLWKYTLDGVTASASTIFAPKSNEVVSRLAVSPDGTAAAVVYNVVSSGGALVSSRIKAGRLDGVGVEYERTQSVTSPYAYPVSTVLTFTSNNVVAFGARKTGSPLATWSATLNGASAPTLTTGTGLGAVYDLGTDGTSWYVFRDPTASTTQVAKSATPYSPGTFEDFPAGTKTTRYVPARATPPVVAADVTAVTSRATATSYLFFAKSSVPTGTKVLFASLAAYMRDSTGTLASDAKAQTRYGQLSASTRSDMSGATKVTTYAGSSLITWPTGQKFGNGRTSALTRNTWFQWCFLGDAFAKPDCSATKKITVNPTMSVGVQKLSGKKRVYGKVARTGGSAVLWRFASSTWVPIASAALSSTGTFSFGFRSLAAGSYKVTTKADTSWGAGLKQLTL